MSENSKSFRSPIDDDVRVRIGSEDLRDEVVHDLRLLVPLHLGARAPAAGSGPYSGSSPPFELKWLAITNRCCPSNMNSPASGLRLAFQAVFVGSIRPGLNVSCVDAAGAGDRGRCGRGPAGAVDERRAAVGAEEEDLADVAARRAAVLVVDGVDLAPVVGRAARRWIAATSFASVRSAATTPLFGGAVVVLHLLDRDHVGRLQVVRRSGREPVELRLRVARREVLDVERRDRELVRARGAVVSGVTPSSDDACGSEVTSRKKLPKL